MHERPERRERRGGLLMAVPLNPAARALLDGPCFGHLATLMPDGAPKVDPVWVLREGDHVLVTSDAKSIKIVNTARDARVSLSIVARDDPYDQLLVRGTVVERRGDPRRCRARAAGRRGRRAPRSTTTPARRARCSRS